MTAQEAREVSKKHNIDLTLIIVRRRILEYAKKGLYVADFRNYEYSRIDGEIMDVLRKEGYKVIHNNVGLKVSWEE